MDTARTAPALAVIAAALASAGGAAPAGAGHPGGLATIVREDVEAHVRALAAPGREGRDTPSLGLEEAARYVAARFHAAGLRPAPDAPAATGADDAARRAAEVEAFLRPFQQEHAAPDPARSKLSLSAAGEAQRDFALGRDFVPLPGCEGEAAGELAFVGFGILERSERWNELSGEPLRGKIAVIVEGEPRHKKRFDGPEVSKAASLAAKLDALREAGAAGAILVRRPTVLGEPVDAADAHEREGLSFRHTLARWDGDAAPDTLPATTLPAVEVTAACASALLGAEVLEIVARIEQKMLPQRIETRGRRAAIGSGVVKAPLRVDNVVGFVPGGDLASEYVVVGAHYDHIGVDLRGRIGVGADDNASGTAAVIELAEALAAAGPRRGVIVCAFAGEEDGLLGARAFCERPPVPLERVVAMLNLDMVGRGPRDAVTVLGLVQNPGLEKLLGRAKKLGASGVSEVVTRKGEELFPRSDHFVFHERGVPVLFFIEGLPLSKNPDYHTWRDTIDRLDLEKITRTSRFVYNTAWLLANDDEAPARP